MNMISPRIYSTIHLFIIFMSIQHITSDENGYLRYVKDGCFIKGEALSCVKYKALKIAKKSLFGDYMLSNETIKANHIISFVPLDADTIAKLSTYDKNDSMMTEPRGFMSEWVELAKYFTKLVRDFFKVKGLRVDLPEGARTVTEEEQEIDDGRGRRKKLAVVIPLLTLLATIKTKMLLIPVLLSVMIIKKVLLIAALLLPSLLNTLKACKHHHPMTHYSYFGNSENSDMSSDYGSSYTYGTNSNYGASNRAYTVPKLRASPAPVYITAPGPAV